MDERSFVANPVNSDPVPVVPGITAKNLIDRLCAEAKNRRDPELIAKINEVKGLYTGYDTISHPDIADTVIVKLGLIIDYLLATSPFDPYSVFLEKNQTDLIYFLQEQREKLNQADDRIEDVNAFAEQFDRYLALRGKKEQTRKIYKGKVKAVFRNYQLELPIRITDFEKHLHEILTRGDAGSKKDHNLSSTISNLCDYIEELLGR